jgi:hypothetical protein
MKRMQGTEGCTDTRTTEMQGIQGKEGNEEMREDVADATTDVQRVDG